MLCDDPYDLLRVRQECPICCADRVNRCAGGALGLSPASVQDLNRQLGLLCKEASDGTCVVMSAGGGSLPEEALGQNLMCSVASL